MVKNNYPAVLTSLALAAPAVSLFGQVTMMESRDRIPSPSIALASLNAAAKSSAASAHTGSFIDRCQARATATQNEQPHWVNPLVTVSSRLERELSTDFVHQYNPKGFAVWNYGNGKGLEFIPERRVILEEM